MSTKLKCMPKETVAADTFIGKKVIDREGIEYGKIKHIHINPDTLVISGVTITQGLGKEHYLAKDYIDKFSEKTLHLSRPPIMIGVTVTDCDRNRLGKIKDTHNNPDTGEVESIEVSDGLARSKVIPKSEIWGIGEKVILKISKKEFKKSEWSDDDAVAGH